MLATTLFAMMLQAAGPAAAARKVQPPLTRLPTVHDLPLLSSIRPVPRPMPKLVDVHLSSLPDSMLRLVRSDIWTTTDRAPPAASNTISGTTLTLYVMHRTHPLPSSCSIGSDRIDLSTFRRNGFVPVAIDRVMLHEPGHNDRDSAPVRSVSEDANGKPTTRIEDTYVLYQAMPVWGIKSPPRVDRIAPFQLCSAGYTLDITVRGPEGISPYTGQRIVHHPVN